MKPVIDPSWKKIFEESKIPFTEFDAKKWDAAGFTPSFENVFRVFQLPLSEVKLVILGQDPYPQKGVATGRSFEVGGLESWTQPIRQTSLRNLLVQYCSSLSNGKISALAEAREYVHQHPGEILSPYQFWEATEKKGVLWLNVALNTIVGKAGAHIEEWNDFSTHVLRALNKQEHVRFMAWGNHAKEILEAAGVNEKKILADPHPRVWSKNKQPQHLHHLFKLLK
jgi:uracil-DNA glycosylase